MEIGKNLIHGIGLSKGNLLAYGACCSYALRNTCNTLHFYLLNHTFNVASPVLATGTRKVPSKYRAKFVVLSVFDLKK